MEKDYKSLFEEAFTPMILLTSKGKYINHNKSYRKLMGYTDKESLTDFSPADVSPKYQPNGQTGED